MAKILLAMPALESIPTPMATFLKTIESKHDVKFITTTRCLIHSARNKFLEACVEHDCDYLIMIDSDNIPYYRNFIDMLADDDKDVVSGVIRLRNNEQNLNIVRAEKVEGPDKYINYKENVKGLVEIDNCGSGLVCIKRKVVDEMLKKHPRPFENKYSRYIKTKRGYKEFGPDVFKMNDFVTNKQGGLSIIGREMSEDFLFFERAKELGFRIFADSRLTCVHLSAKIISV